MLLLSKMVNAADFPTLQMAVDALEEFGTLYVPAGEWACSGIKLKSNMTLHLALGAKLVKKLCCIWNRINFHSY